MQIVVAARCSVTTSVSVTSWVAAAIALMAMPTGRDDHAAKAENNDVLDAVRRERAPASTGPDACHDAAQSTMAPDGLAACREIQEFVSNHDVSTTSNQLFDAYDRFALAHLDVAGADGVDDWLMTVRPDHAAMGAKISANRVLIVWSEPYYLRGARASLFGRDRRGHWARISRRSLDLEGQYVTLRWARDGVFLIGGVFQGADAAWLSLIGLDARGSSIRVQPVVTHLWEGGGRDLDDGIVVGTIVAPTHFITHLFSNWREQEVTVEWTGRRFRTTKRETEPVIAALERYCAHRPTCAKATLQDVEYMGDRRAHAIFSGMPNDCEYGEPEVTVELAKTAETWRVVSLACSAER